MSGHLAIYFKTLSKAGIVHPLRSVSSFIPSIYLNISFHPAFSFLINIFRFIVTIQVSPSHFIPRSEIVNNY